MTFVIHRSVQVVRAMSISAPGSSEREAVKTMLKRTNLAQRRKQAFRFIRSQMQHSQCQTCGAVLSYNQRLTPFGQVWSPGFSRPSASVLSSVQENPGIIQFLRVPPAKAGTPNLITLSRRG